MTEYRGFVVAVTFILLFSVIVSAIPSGYQGLDIEPEEITPVNPEILAGFAESEQYVFDNFTENLVGYYYQYELGSRYWQMTEFDDLGYFQLYERILWFVFQIRLDACSFISEDKTDRGTSLSFTEIDSDAIEGQATYSLKVSGNSAGALIVWYNTTLYDNSSHAWDNEELWFLHGIGFESAATNNVGALVVSLLFLQLPDVPILLGLIIAAPLWASIGYLLWFIIKSMIPFLS